MDVIVTRPGFHVRARPGYVASRADPTTTRDRLDSALSAGLPGGPLLTSAVGAFLTRDSHRTRILLTIDIPYAGFNTQSPATDDQVQLAWLALDADGRTRASGEQSLPVRVSDQKRTPFVASFHDAVVLPNERLTLRIAVYSRLQNAIGAVHLPLDLREDAPRSLLLALADDDRVHVATPAALRRGLPVFPQTRRIFERRERLHVLTRLDARALTEENVRLTLIATDETRRTIPIRIEPSDGERNVFTLQSTLELDTVDAGRYLVELSIDRSDGARLSRLEFEVK